MAVIEAIATTYLEADAASVTWTSISSTYAHLRIVVSGADSDESSTTGYYYIRLNGGTAGNYYNHRIMAEGTSETTGANAGQTYIWSPFLPGRKRNGSFLNYGPWVLDILDYTNSNKNTTVLWKQGFFISTSYRGIGIGCGLWDDTEAIDEITLSADVGGGSAVWLRGSSFTLYGLNSS